MSFDYYVVHFLKIYYNDSKTLNILLDLQRDTFYDPNDTPEQYFNKKKLTPLKKPIIIYENNNFTDIVFKEKFKHLFEKNNLNKTAIILLIERRFESDYEFKNYPFS